MKNTYINIVFVTFIIILSASSIVNAQIVSDPLTEFNTGKTSTSAESIDKTTKASLERETKIDDSTKKTLDASTGDRTSDTKPLANAGAGTGYTASQAPSLLPSITPTISPTITLSPSPSTSQNGNDKNNSNQATNQSAEQSFKNLNLEQNLSGNDKSTTSNDKSYQLMMSTSMSLQASIQGTQAAIPAREAAYQQASQTIGQSKDIKGSLDQNSQLQVQTGQTLNQLIGVMNGSNAAQQVSNLRNLTDLSNTKQALSYSE
ncbi:conjugal transfer protein [Ochrobactrum sp. SFR4]|uniref:conjugal transfer protein n=1 Tax=Ochrobactrum sp. SFR4 TaxID=2717368 RepID=UPI001C8C3CC3|nr:conjugal transfer protein [Ochrobactrum sp. SFR4]MBX8827184.1 conjugal transfer protein [Ochrobactrum sp. SFR4]